MLLTFVQSDHTNSTTSAVFKVLLISISVTAELSCSPVNGLCWSTWF